MFLKRKIAALLLLCVLLGSTQSGTVFAEEPEKVIDSPGVVSEENTESAESAELAGSIESVESAELAADGYGETELSLEGDNQNASEGIENLNYIYINEKEVEPGQEQSIVVSWGGDLSVGTSSLVLEDDYGRRVTIYPDAVHDGEVLFCHVFERGIYRPVLFCTDEMKVDLVEGGILAYFGVGENCEAREKSEHVEMDSLISSESEEGKSASAETVEITRETIQNAAEDIMDALSAGETEMIQNSLGNSEGEAGDSLMEGESAGGDIVVVLSPGHDSRFTGAYGNGVREEEANLKIAQYCKQELEKYGGVRVYMARTGANSGFGTNAKTDIVGRVAWAASVGADAYISIHLNAFNASSKGAEVYYYSGYSSGRGLAEKVQNELVGLGIYNRGVKDSDEYWVLQETRKYGINGIIVEHCFISNPQEAEKYLKTEEGLKSLGVADARGIAKYYNLSVDHWEYRAPYWYFKQGNTYGTGWLLHKDSWYYLAPSASMPGGKGAMQVGWLKLGADTFYLNEKNGGRMAKGLLDIGGNRYFFNASGYMQKNAWEYVGGKWYYFGQDGRALSAGKKVIGGKSYYFADDGSLVRSGWVYVKSINSYYFIKNDEIYTGWLADKGRWYYLSPSANLPGGIGAMQKGWMHCGDLWVYLEGSGAMVTGLNRIDSGLYFFSASGYMAKNQWIAIGSDWYYAGGDGRLFTGGGFVINNKKYCFDGGGKLLNNGWTLDSSTKKYFYVQDGELCTGWKQVGGKWYYLSEYGTAFLSYGEMQTGWLRIGNALYYLEKSGAMATGRKYIEEERRWYVFHETGGWLISSEGERIMASCRHDVVKKMTAFYKSSGRTFPSHYRKYGVNTIEDLAEIYYEEATKQGVRADVAFCQAMLETGWLTFSGDVKIAQLNFAGIGATGGGNPGNSFSSVRIGVRAQIQHLYAYASSDDKLVEACVDPRYKYVKKGSAPYVLWLSSKTNPSGVGWASSKDYGSNIEKMLNRLNNM